MRLFKENREKKDLGIWFAWYPVFAWDGDNLGKVWLEKVQVTQNENSSYYDQRN